ncbi:MAG: Ppx/GppA family phosphatase [Rubrivivax sp.]|jgi:exopolyphosphatase/guanosine-5'-triphosphate,3'-diphosphate pyrophosphatase|nr:Ppx/GppA family phosphatase [Rubrivivax sp.]
MPFASATRQPGEPGPANPETLAAVDIGSNSMRLELGSLHRGRYRRVQYLKRMVRLGADLDASSRLSEAGIQRGLDCLAEFGAVLEGIPARLVRAVATQTLREAANRDEFLARGQPVLGYPIEVISGREEARLIFAGVACLQPSDKPRLVVDIGGRSTELILGLRHTPASAESFPVGSVGLSMRWFPDGAITPEAMRAAQVAAGAQFEEALAEFAPDRWEEALGSSGTAGAVSDVLKAMGLTDGRITPAALQHLIDMALRAGHVSRLDIPGLKDDRRAVIPGGLAILYTLVTHFGIRELRPAKGALRQGVIIDLHERLQAANRREPRDVRDHTVGDLQQRFQVDLPQARRVMHTALALYDSAGLSDAFAADAGMQGTDTHGEARRELQWAAALHEVGLCVSHHDHHRHSSYLLGHVDAPGFSQSQQRRLAELVLAQRGGLRKVEALLQKPSSAWQVLCLRLAIIRCHARSDAPDNWRLKRVAPLTAQLRWHTEHDVPNPRTLFLLQEEAAAWQNSGAMGLRLPR